MTNKGTAKCNIIKSESFSTHAHFVSSQSHKIIGNNPEQFLTTAKQNLSNFKLNSNGGTSNTHYLISNSTAISNIINSGNELQNSNHSIINSYSSSIENQLPTAGSQHIINSSRRGSQSLLNPQSRIISGIEVAQNVSSVKNQAASITDNTSNLIFITSGHQPSNLGKLLHTNVSKGVNIASNSGIYINKFDNTSLSKQNSNRIASFPSQLLSTTKLHVSSKEEELRTNVLSKYSNNASNLGITLENVSNYSLQKENSNICLNHSNQIPPLVFTASNQSVTNLGTKLPVDTNKLFLALVPNSKPNNTTVNIPLNISTTNKSLAKKFIDRLPRSNENYRMLNKVLQTKEKSMVKNRLKKYKEQLKRGEIIGDYFCPICQIECGNAELLKEHKERKDFVCRICTAELVSHGELESHFEKHILFECNICEEVFFGRHDLKLHQEENHPDQKSFKCKICDKTFFRKKALTEHIFFCHNYRSHKTFKCEVCGRAFKRACVWKAHSLAAHSAYEYVECKYCQKLVLGPAKLKIHIKMVHIDSECNRPASCKSCGKVFKTVNNLINHQKNHHEMVEESPCELCGKSIKSKLEMQRHMNNEHSKDKIFTCKFCNKQFGGKQSLLKKHINEEHRIRKKPIPVFCEICGKLFKNSLILKHHKKIHSEERPYKCEICNATFRQQATLKTHTRVHSSFGVYNCLKCGMDFKWKQTFDKHVKKCKSEDESELLC